MKAVTLVILLLIPASIWSSYKLSDSRHSMKVAEKQFTSCKQVVKQIEKIRLRTTGTGIAAESYDCSRDIRSLLDQNKIVVRNSISSRDIQAEDAGLKTKRVPIPIDRPVELQQLLGLLQAANASPVRFFTDSIELRAPPKRTLEGEPELWEVVEFDLNFVSRASAD